MKGQPETRNQKLTNQQAKPFAAVAHCAAYMVLRVKHTINDRKERSNGKNFCISRYGVYMYPEKNGRHNRPHVHVMYGDDECVLSVPEGEVLAGEISGKQLRNA